MSFVNKCWFTSGVSGYTDFTDGDAVLSFQNMADAGCVNGRTYSYSAQSADGLQWEVGSGVYKSADDDIARSTITDSSSGGSKVNFTLAPLVLLTLLTADLALLDVNVLGQYIEVTSSRIRWGAGPSNQTFGHDMRVATAGVMYISGGTSSSQGANIWMYGQSHSSHAGDFLFRVGNSTKLQYDHSQNRWEVYQDMDFRSIGDITGLQGLNMLGNLVTAGLVDTRDVKADGAKLDNIDSGADVTPTATTSTRGKAEAATASEIRNDDQTIAKFVSPRYLNDALAFSSLYDSSTIYANMDSGLNFKLAAMRGNRTLGNPYNEDGRSGRGGVIVIVASGADRTLTFGSQWYVDPAISLPFSIASGKRAIITYVIEGTSVFLVTGISIDLT